MKIWPMCVPCIYNVRAREIVESRMSREEKILALKEFTRFYQGEIDPETSTIILATLAFRKVKELIGDEDPYREFKEKSYRVSEELAERVRQAAGKLTGYERFRLLVKASLAANFFDPGAPLGTGPESSFEIVEKLKLARDETDSLYLSILQSDTVTYLLDNAGEALLDKLVLEELHHMGINLKIVPKGKPYQNDITYQEAVRIGLHKLGQLIDTQTDAAGPIKTLIPPQAWQAINEADIIISKGMANFEALTYNPPETPAFAMLVAKCQPVASAAGIKPGQAAAFYITRKPDLLKIK